MSKNKIVGIVVVGLILAVGVLAFINRGDIEEKKSLEESASFNVVYGEESFIVSMEDMVGLNPVDFVAIRDTSNTDPEEVSYTGVEIINIIEHLQLDIQDATVIEIKALDGYTSALTVEEVLESENVYMVIKENGENLKNKSEGGNGPYMMIIRSSQFSQRWCKFVQEIIIK